MDCSDKLPRMTFRTLIDATALAASMGRPELAIIDCRFNLMQPRAGRDAYLAGHIPGARYASLDEDLSAPVTRASGRHPLPHPADLAATLRRLGVSHSSQVVAYDASDGSFAARLWWLLRWAGHEAVAVLDGGMAAWRAAGHGAESGAVEIAPAAAFAVQPRSDMVVDAAEVETLRVDPTRVLLDARAADRFQGRVEPIDPVAGHIPGALNHPFAENLSQDGRFLDREELQSRWKRRLGEHPAARAVMMCGSGVTACHNLLSLEIAGLQGAKLYAGSWSEWIRDPQRATARGI
jgi:thiosulfate/3-mercaptopyruvate sulfurtransferase